MLAPGDYLTKPPPITPDEEPGKQGPVGTAEPNTPAVPAREAGEPETRSFLLTLLRALGAVHT